MRSSPTFFHLIIDIYSFLVHSHFICHRRHVHTKYDNRKIIIDSFTSIVDNKKNCTFIIIQGIKEDDN